MIEVLKYFDSAASAAEYYKIPYATFIDYMEKYDIPRKRWTGGPRVHGRRINIPIDEALALSAAGTTYEELAQKYGVSYGVIVKRMKEAGHKAPWRRTADPRFKNVQSQKRSVLRQLGITACEICGETRAIDFCHIKPAASGGPISAQNCLVLCPNHHRLYDSDSLITQELAKIQPKIDLAREIYGGW
jgi:hypothetical protein